jgi:hypothetical protein
MDGILVAACVQILSSEFRVSHRHGIATTSRHAAAEYFSVPGSCLACGHYKRQASWAHSVMWRARHCLSVSSATE